MAFVEFSRRAPTGFLVVPDNGDPEDDSQTTLIQTDWDYPGVARSMGWGGEDDQFSEAYDWIREHEGEEFEGLDDYLAQENPCMSNPGTADSWNAGREWAKADMASGIKQQYTAEAWERWARTKDWTGYTQKDLDNSRRNFIHAYEQAMGRRGKRNPNPVSETTFGSLPVGAAFRFTSYGSGSFLGQSDYVKTGSRTYRPADLEAAKEEYRRLYQGYPDILKKMEREGFRKSTGLKVGSIHAKVIPAEGNPVMNGRSYVRRGVPPPRYWEPRQGDVVYIEGTKTTLGRPGGPDGDMFPLKPSVHGTTAMGAANLRQVAMVEPREGNPKTGSDHPLAWYLANFARSKYSRRAVHIKAVTDYLIKLRDQGNYNLKSATKAYYYVIEGASKEYAKEYGTKPPAPVVKMEAARDLMSMVEGGRG